MSGARRAFAAWLLGVSIAAAPGCRGCRDRDAGAGSRGDAARAGAREVTFELAPAAPAAPLAWKAAAGLEGVGLPAGCRVELPVRRAPLPDGARFFAVRGAFDRLAVAHGDGDAVARRALLDPSGSVAGDLPWQRLDQPPPAARAAGGVVAAIADGPRALLWQRARPALELASGDQLAVHDLACHERRCALLTTLARPALAPGATLAIGDPERAGSWRTIDIEADPGKPWRPLGIVAIDADSVAVSLTSGGETALWSVRGEHATEVGTLPTPFGVWDVVATPQPLVIAPTRAGDGGCQNDGVPLRLARFGKPAHDVTVSVPPESVIARPLGRGAIVAWVAPVSCKIDRRIVVHALLVDAAGTAASTPMAVTDASGFALATEGDRVSLWLRTAGEITWIVGNCARR